jgi:hypothetical protein
MTLEEFFLGVLDKGFAIAVASFLLWKGYNQDKEYLNVLTDIKNDIRQHTAQKEALIELLEKR